MTNHFFEQLIASFWNRLRGQDRRAWSERGSLDLGNEVRDGELTRRHLSLSNARRTMHLCVLGKSGSGKSSLLKHIAQNDIASDRGFLYFDLHGDATPFLLKTINARERKLRRHLSDKLALIQTADPMMSVGLNPLETDAPDFVQIAEVVEVLKRRWGLDHFGARTEELLRNALYAVAANHLTLVELTPFLTHGAFRLACLKNVPNAEVKEYFELRYDQASEAMRATMREPILNKTSAFTADPRFRHIVGQPHSTFSIRDAMDQSHWVIVDLEKGKLGEQAATLGSLILSVVKNALFSSKERFLFSLYCDEIQNLVAYGSGIETLLSEARKFGVGVVTANQFLDQYPAEVRAAILSVGTQAFFQLSGQDAAQVAQALDGGKALAERLKNLPQRHCVVKTGSDRAQEILVPRVQAPAVDPIDLVNRTRYTRGKVRAHVDRDIAARHKAFLEKADEALHEWE
jgi:energy-coupling factor transporter ATP-binding protein EcfA2